MDIRIPQLGEGADSGTVVTIFVKEGDSIRKDQTLLELENEKAVAPIPSPEGGTVSKIHVKVGDKVSVGQVIVSLSGEGAEAPAPPAAQAPAAPKPAPTAAPAASSPKPSASGQEYAYESKSGFPPPASPTIRKIARDLGIDLTRVRGSEEGGRIALADLKSYIERLQSASAPPAATASKTAAAPAESIDFSKWGKIERKPLSSLREKIGQKMTESWTTIPHVTQLDEADITELMALRKKYLPAYEKKGASLTVTSFILKAVVSALRKYPIANSSLDENTREIVFKEYYHLGVAVDTEQGLIVPVLKDADKKSLLDLTLELAKLAERTRQRKISLEDLKGGTFTISNLGGIGVGHFSPIINKPEVAILGVGRGVMKPVASKDKDKAKGPFEPRIMLPLALSYDHRVIDGADGARFIRAVVEALEKFPEKDVKL